MVLARLRPGGATGGGRVAAAPGGLPAGRGAVPAPAGGGERLAAGRAGPYRYAISSRDGVRAWPPAGSGPGVMGGLPAVIAGGPGRWLPGWPAGGGCRRLRGAWTPRPG